LAQVEELIQSTLEKLAETGFSSTAIEAALNTTEFHLRENNTGRFPRGLSLMLRAMGNWIYDKDPYEALQWTQALDNFKVRCRSACICLPIFRVAVLCSFTTLIAWRSMLQDAGHKAEHLPLTVQARLSSGEDIFGPLINKFLLSNKHKVCLSERNAGNCAFMPRL
jgi:Zn-dependent M16 (insulinase) family peptidase